MQILASDASAKPCSCTILLSSFPSSVPSSFPSFTVQPPPPPPPPPPLSFNQRSRMLRSTSAKSIRLARFDRLASTTHLHAARAYSSRPPSKPQKNHPSPVGFVVIAIAAFGVFAYISRSRHDDPQKHLREKRIPHPNPLIPPRSQEPQ